MRHSKPFSVAVALAVLFSGFLFRSADAAAAPAVAPAQEAQIGQGAALVTEFEVNGLKVLFKRRAGSLTVSSGLFFRGGARNINEKNAGIEAVTLETATEGGLKYPRLKLRNELSRTGATLGAGANYDYSVLALGTPRTHFDRAWDMYADVILNPAFAQEDLTRIQERMVSSLRDDTDDPDTLLQRLQEQDAYAGHPYMNRPQGTPENIGKFKPADLKAYHKTLLATSQMLLVVVGDLEVADLKAKVTAVFGKLPKGNDIARPLPQLAFDKPNVAVTAKDLPTNYIQGVYVAPPMTSPDFAAMRLASAILRDRVFEEVRIKRNLSYAPSAFLNSQGANIGGIYVSAVDANRATSVMLDEINRLQNDLVDERELRGTVSQFLTTYYVGQETNAAQAAELALFELVGGGWRNAFTVIDKLRAVTPVEVRRVSREYMKNLHFVVIGNPAQIDKATFTRKLPVGDNLLSK
jgi:predicted Zn-dependent peptidase